MDGDDDDDDLIGDDSIPLMIVEVRVTASTRFCAYATPSTMHDRAGVDGGSLKCRSVHHGRQIPSRLLLANPHTDDVVVVIIGWG